MSASIGNATSWTKATLGQFCGERGKSIDPSKEPERTFELYSIPSFPTGRPEIASGKDIGSNKQLVEPRTVLLGKINPRINRAWVVGDFTDHAKLASTEWLLFPPSPEIEPDFLCYYLQQNQLRDFLAANASGVGGSLMRVKPSTLRDFPFAYPHRAEQQEIVAEIEKQFTRLEAGVAGLRRVQTKLKRYRAAVLKAACEGKLVSTEVELARQENRSYEPGAKLLERILTERRQKWNGKGKYKEPVKPDTTDLPPLPEGWTWATVDQIAMLVTDGDHNPPKRQPAGVPHLTAKHVRNWRLYPVGCTFISTQDAERVFRRYRPLVGDLIVTCVGTVGRTAIVPPDFEFSPDRNLAAVRLVEQRDAVPYLNFVFSSPDYQQRIAAASGSTAQPHFYLGDLRALTIPIPPAVEQQRIVAEVERRLSVVEEIESVVNANLQRATRLRQSVLQTMFIRESI